MKYSFYSNFSDRIRSFISYKNSLGYPYHDSSRVMRNFDVLCAEHFPQKTWLDQEIGMLWSERKGNESNGGHRNRVMVLREFAKYLCSIGESAYMIPIQLTRKPKKPTPHIFSEEELTCFFRASDQFEPHKDSPIRHLVIPVFFRLVYCCGLRPAEARLLCVEHVDLQRGVIRIVESKGHKDRLVMLSDDIAHLLGRYQKATKGVFPECQYLFPRYDGAGPYTKRWTEEMFWRCWEMAGVTEFCGPRPRVYDFRHTFATRCIYRWMQEGRDADAMLPYLSAYMGHSSLDDTAYYIHLVPDLFSALACIPTAQYEALLPEVPYEN